MKKSTAEESGALINSDIEIAILDFPMLNIHFQIDYKKFPAFLPKERITKKVMKILTDAGPITVSYIHRQLLLGFNFDLEIDDDTEDLMRFCIEAMGDIKSSVYEVIRECLTEDAVSKSEGLEAEAFVVDNKAPILTIIPHPGHKDIHSRMLETVQRLADAMAVANTIFDINSDLHYHLGLAGQQVLRSMEDIDEIAKNNGVALMVDDEKELTGAVFFEGHKDDSGSS